MSKKNRRYFYLIGGIILFFLIFGLAIIWPYGEESTKVEEIEEVDNSPVIEEPKFFHPLTGEVVSEENKIVPVSVIIDNIEYSHPLSGLEKASIVYEAPVEGDITRFLAIFDDSDLPSKIGPIRSARPYFIDFSEEYGGIFIHAGGSPEALSRLNNTSLYNLDEFKYGNYFYRDVSREAPYNLYITGSSIKKFIKDFNVPPNFSVAFSPWQYKEEEKNWPYHGPEIKINFKKEIVWRYNNDGQFYEREGGNFKTKNLIILETDIKSIDELDRRFIRTEGSGRAFFLEKGKAFLGLWKKEAGRIKFYDEEGKEVSLLPGNTWIEIVYPGGGSLSL